MYAKIENIIEDRKLKILFARMQKLKIAPPPIGTQLPLKRLKFRFRPKNQSQFR